MVIRRSLSSQFCSKRKSLGIYHFRITLVINLNYSFPVKCKSCIFYMKFLSWFWGTKFTGGEEFFFWSMESYCNNYICNENVHPSHYLYILFNFILGFWTLSATSTGKIWCLHKKGLSVDPLSRRKGRR